MAEASGLIDSIGEWVLRNACRQAARELPGLCIAVNVSPAQFLRPDFLDSVSNALATAGLEPGRLEVEVTESLFMGEVPIALNNLHGLRKLGVRVALDDFGTGYSSLAYLSTLPIDSLKIDGSFVRGMSEAPQNVEIVRAVLNLGRSLGKKVIAEGIETVEQLATLQAMGVHVGQGYLLSRPLRAAQVPALLGEPVQAPPQVGALLQQVP